MTERHELQAETAPGMDGHESGHNHGTPRGYLIGFVLSVILTGIPFWLVMSGVLSTPATAVIVVLMAIAQILVHTVFFLHINTKAEGGWTLVALVFTAVMVLIVICGSLWIMYHLHGNMMPAAPRSAPAIVSPAA